MIFLYNIEQCFPNFSSRSPHQAPNLLEGRTAAGHARGQATHSQGDRMGRACLGFWSEPMLNPVFLKSDSTSCTRDIFLKRGWINDWLNQRSLESINIGLKEQEEFVTSPTKNQIWPTDISALSPVLHFHIFHYGILWPLKSGAGGIHVESPIRHSDLRQVPIARGVVDLDLCEVGGSESLRSFWPHYMCPGDDLMGAMGMPRILKVARYEW